MTVPTFKLNKYNKLEIILVRKCNVFRHRNVDLYIPKYQIPHKYRGLRVAAGIL